MTVTGGGVGRGEGCGAWGRGYSPDGVETDAVIVQHDVETEGAHHHRMDVGGDCHW